MSYPAGCITSHIDASCNGDGEPIDELDELAVLDCGHSGTLRNAEHAAGELICEDCFIERKNLIASLMGGLSKLCR